MTVEIKRNGPELVIELAGRLDSTTAPELDKVIDENAYGVGSLILDIKKLEYVSSAGLRVILAAHKKVHKSGHMKIKNACEAVMEVFEVTGFADILVIE